MGSPVSIVVLDMYIEYAENEAMDTTPSDTTPSLRRHYMDDSFEVLKPDKQDELTKILELYQHHQ